MKLIKTALQLVGARPFILWFPALIGLAFSLINMYNPLSSIFLGLSSITGANLLDTLISFLQIVLDSAYLPLAAAGAVGIALAAAFIGSFFMGGYFNILNSALAGKPKVPGEFFAGVKKSYGQLLKVNLVTFFLGLLVLLFLLVASVPSVIISKAAFTSRPDLLLAAVFVDFLTIAVVFFGLMFFTSYALFWYPAAVNYSDKPFQSTRGVVNAGFFSIVGRLLVFYIFFAASYALFIEINGTILAILLGWLFNTIFFVLLSVYIFARYAIGLKKPMEEE